MRRHTAAGIEPPHTTAPGTPANAVTADDVLIRTVAHGMGAEYAVSGMADGEPERFTSMRAASQRARAYARPVGVDVWVEQASGSRLLVGRFRKPGSRRAATW